MAVFEVYAGNQLIHHSQSPSPDVKLLDPKLTLEVNAAGSFKCKIPPSNVGFLTVNRLTTVIYVKKNGTEIWSGRIIEENSDFWGNRSITCEGALAYLNDTSQPPHEYHEGDEEHPGGVPDPTVVKTFLQKLITIHNEKVSVDKRFAVGIVTVTDPNNYIYRFTNYESTMEAIKEKLVDKLGGYIVLRKENGVNTIDYLKEPLNTCSQTIEFGKNLIEFSKSWNLSDFVTVIVPQGEHLDEHPVDPDTGEDILALDAYLDVTSVNGGSPYVYYQNMVEQYGWIESKVSWSDVGDPSNLLSKAYDYLSDMQFENMVLELSAIDLSYMMGSESEGLKIFDKIHCISEAHGMDRYFPLTKMTIPLDNPSGTEFTLGDNTVRTSLSASLRNDQISVKEQFDDEPSTTTLIDKVVSEAHTDAEEIMNAKTNGYVTIVTEEDQTGIHSEKIVVSDNKNYLNATRKWEWGLNGLAYYRNGTNIGLALTMDGAIVADRITTGTLNAARIKAGVLSDVRNNNYWDLETGEFRLTASASSTIGGKTVDTIATEQATSTLNTFVNGTYATDKTNLQNQIDGKAETWYQANDPSAAWTTTELKDSHIGDLWYKTTDSTTWIYQKSGSTYSWQQENVPQEVFDQIDGKAQIFTSQPAPPYNVGDLWFGGTNSDIKTCTTARTSGSYVSTDWVKYNKYTDDSAVNNLNTSLNSTEVFRRLTNGGTIQGIFTGYDSQGNLGYYINAEHIAAGVITDPTGTNMEINLRDAYIMTGGTTYVEKTTGLTKTYYSKLSGGELLLKRVGDTPSSGKELKVHANGLDYYYNSNARSGIRMSNKNYNSNDVGYINIETFNGGTLDDIAFYTNRSFLNLSTYDAELASIYYDSTATPSGIARIITDAYNTTRPTIDLIAEGSNKITRLTIARNNLLIDNADCISDNFWVTNSSGEPARLTFTKGLLTGYEGF